MKERKTCTVKGCGNYVYARGLCRTCNKGQPITPTDKIPWPATPNSVGGLA